MTDLVREREVSIFSAFFGTIKKFFVVSREESALKTQKCKMCCKTCQYKVFVDSNSTILMKCTKKEMLTVQSDMVCPRYDIDQEIEA